MPEEQVQNQPVSETPPVDDGFSHLRNADLRHNEDDELEWVFPDQDTQTGSSPQNDFGNQQQPATDQRLRDTQAALTQSQQQLTAKDREVSELKGRLDSLEGLISGAKGKGKQEVRFTDEQLSNLGNDPQTLQLFIVEAVKHATKNSINEAFSQDGSPLSALQAKSQEEAEIEEVRREFPGIDQELPRLKQFKSMFPKSKVSMADLARVFGSFQGLITGLQQEIATLRGQSPPPTASGEAGRDTSLQSGQNQSNPSQSRQEEMRRRQTETGVRGNPTIPRKVETIRDALDNALDQLNR